MTNALILMLNNKDHLPFYLVIIPDKDLLTWYKHYAYGISRILHVDLKHFVDEVEKVVKTRREQLLQIRPGAVATKTKIIWVNMLARPFIWSPDGSDKVFTQTAKFNFILQETLANKAGYIMSIDHMKDCHFDRYGNLNTSGKIHFWKELDYLLKKFDHNELDLKAKLE